MNLKSIRENKLAIIMVVLSIIMFAYILASPCKVKEGKYHAESCVVVGCDYVNGDYQTDTYLVTVHTKDGNEWQYYDSSWLPKGYLLRCYFDRRTSAIVDVDY